MIIRLMNLAPGLERQRNRGGPGPVGDGEGSALSAETWFRFICVSLSLPRRQSPPFLHSDCWHHASTFHISIRSMTWSVQPLFFSASQLLESAAFACKDVVRLLLFFLFLLASKSFVGAPKTENARDEIREKGEKAFARKRQDSNRGH